MIFTTTMFCLLLAADAPPIEKGMKPRLVIVPNATKILQRDHLRLLVLVENRGKTDIKILHGRGTCDEYVRFEVRQDKGWRKVRTMKDIGTNEGVGFGGPDKERGRAVLAGSAYAEFPAFLRDGDSFLFDRPGEYQLRGIVQTGEKELVSDPVTITVDRRPAAHLRRIEEASDVLPILELRVLSWEFRQKLTALADVGGNIAQAINDTRVLQQFASAGTVDGAQVPKDKIADVLRMRLDPVTWEMALQLLGYHYFRRTDHEGMAQIATAMPHDSFERRNLLRSLRLRGPMEHIRQDLGQPGEEIVESD